MTQDRIKQYLVLLLMCLSLNVNAIEESWKFIGKSGNDAVYVLDNYIQRKGDLSSIMIKVNNSGGSTLHFDCKHKLHLTNEKSVYIKSGTMLEDIYNNACKKEWYEFW